MPIWPHCAVKCKNYEALGLLIEYSILWNVVGFPCGILPITKVQESEQYFSDDYQDAWTAALNDDCKESVGMPINLQVVGYMHRDEQVLGIMKMLEKELGYKIDGNPNIDQDFDKDKFHPKYGYTLNR